MYILAAIALLIGIIAGIPVAACTKKAENVTYGKLGKASRITNVLLIPVYAALSIFCIALSLFTNPRYDGFLGVLGMIVCVIIAMGPISCGLGLGFSAALRKKGKEKSGFIVQFAGLVGCGLSILLFLTFYGNLLAHLN
jgi:hypothetical protein